MRLVVTVLAAEAPPGPNVLDFPARTNLSAPASWRKAGPAAPDTVLSNHLPGDLHNRQVRWRAPRTKLQIATRPPLRLTRRASASAATKSAAKLIAVEADEQVEAVVRPGQLLDRTDAKVGFREPAPGELDQPRGGPRGSRSPWRRSRQRVRRTRRSHIRRRAPRRRPRCQPPAPPLRERVPRTPAENPAQRRARRHSPRSFGSGNRPWPCL
jgi:hypothetical protein